MSWEVRRAADRFVTRAEGRTTWHSFSFGAHYDPARVGVGALVALNDEHLPPGTGYDEHLHRDVEIVSVVLAGSLRHSSEVGEAVLGPGDLQRLTAGAGVTHRERSALDARGPGPETRFVQTWLRPRETGGVPSYSVVRAAVTETGLAVVETGADSAAVLHAGTVVAGRTARLASVAGSVRHVLVAAGSVRVGSVETAGDRTGSRSADLAAGDALLGPADALEIRSAEVATVLAWTTPTV